MNHWKPQSAGHTPLALTLLICLCVMSLTSQLGANDPPAGPNLLRNPSFEEGAKDAPAAWRFWGWAPEGEPRTAKGIWDRSVARTGQASLKIINENPRDIGTWTNREGAGFVPVQPGQVYTVSLYMKVEALQTPLSTHFRCGFSSLDAEGKVTYLPAEVRRQIDPAEGKFTEAGVWKQLALAVKAPAGATHLGLDVDLIGQGVAWIDDVAVTVGYDAAAFGGKQPAPTLALTQGPDLDPPTAATPLTLTFQINNPLVAREVEFTCEVVDYWFRASTFTRKLSLQADDVQDVTVELDAPTRERLFKARTTAGANAFRVQGSVQAGGQQIAATVRGFRFKSRVIEYKRLPALPARQEKIDDIFGTQKLVDVINCFDPRDPHPYIEGGRGMDAKSTGAVPQEEWKRIFREPLKEFTRFETLLGRPFRVTQGWGWFGYKFNREGLKPNTPYVVVLEYPEDKGRTYTVFNTGISDSLVGGYGFHTGKTLGDHWTRTLNSEYTDYPLSGKVERWYSVFHLGAKTWDPAEPWNTAPTRAEGHDGFWVIVGGVGPSQDPLAAGAAVSTLKLYEISNLPALYPKINEPPQELGRRELTMTAESDGLTKFLTDEQARAQWAQVRMREARFMGLNGVSPNGKTDSQPLLKVNQGEKLGVSVFHRWMIERDFLARLGVPPEALARNAQGQPVGSGESFNVKELPDILHPTTLRDALRLITEELGPLTGDPGFTGLMLYKHYGASIPVSFSDFALRLYEQESGVKIAGADSAARREWLLANHKTQYYQWWHTKKRAFLLAVRDHLKALRPDLKLYYFPWHSDDDYPFSCGRLRYSGYPQLDKIYVPGTNILLVPSFTVPPDKWTEAEKARPALARHYYREALAPELEGKLTLEDLIYGRYKDMPQFWGAPRSGELPHLVYPHEMDLIAMLTEPGGMYANGVGHSPRLFREDQDFIYWAPVRHRFTADNPKLLDLFRTGEGSAVAVHMPYNEETSHLNIPAVHGAHGVEHGGAFSMMEEVLGVAHADSRYIMSSMWEPLKRGFPHHAQAFAQAFRALPAQPSQVLQGVLSPDDKSLVVRSYETDYGHYLAIVNPAFDLRQRRVTLTLKPAVSAVAEVLNLATGQTVPFKSAAGGRIAIALTIPPMSLTSLQVVDRTPRAVFRDVELTTAEFSPNGDGRQDTVSLTGGTVSQVRQGRWVAEVYGANQQRVRRFEGAVPQVAFTWDGANDQGQRCADGQYEIRLTASVLPQAIYRRAVRLNTAAPPARVTTPTETYQLTVNNFRLQGKLTGAQPGDQLFLLRAGEPDGLVPVDADGSFNKEVEALALGSNKLSLVVQNRSGNRTAPHELTVNFALDLSQPVNFDFGAGPIMEGFSAIRNDTFYSEARGYGWIKYGNVWKGDRGIGDHLVRDYCSGKEDREWAVKLPNGAYTLKVVMVDTQFDHFAPDIYLEGKKVFSHQTIKANQPLWVTLETEVKDGLLNFEQRNPGHLPYYALNGIIIERK
jgi:hypothetical protein